MPPFSGSANLNEPMHLLLKVAFHDDMLPRFRKIGWESSCAMGGGFRGLAKLDGD